ncbi:MAG: efflux RND transporter periplasmic adaptor subunit [Bacteroidetes bacterium]|nr:efflux RND transporter periplasmic adaptor subunit [Bacteroidota bacterium]
MQKTILILALTTLIASCGSKDKKAQLEKLLQQKTDVEAKIAELQSELSKTDTLTVNKDLTQVSVLEIQPSIFKSYIEIQGKVDADENVSVSSEIPGTITKINVKVGDEVVKGQVLAETDARAVAQQLADLQTNLDLVTQIYEKQKALWDQKIGTEIQYLQAKTNKESLENKKVTLQTQINMSKVISPIAGTIDAVNIKLGQAIAPGVPAISVINFNNLKVKADVAEGYGSRVHTGNETIVYFPDLKDSIVSKIRYASRAINAMTRTFGIEVLLENKEIYRPNMVARIKINDYQSKNPLINIPVKYIQKDDNGSFTLVENNGKVEKKQLELGKEYNGYAEVLKGLNTGDKLIVAGYDLVKEGASVVVKN